MFAVEYDGSKPSGGKRTENGSCADGSKTENGSAADAEDDFKPIRSRRNRSEKKGNGKNEKNSVQTTPKPKA